MCKFKLWRELLLRETYRATTLPRLTRLMSTWESFYSLLSLLRYKGQLQEEQFQIFQIQYTLDFGFVFSCCLSLSLPNIFNQESFLHSYYVHSHKTLLHSLKTQSRLTFTFSQDSQRSHTFFNNLTTHTLSLSPLIERLSCFTDCYTASRFPHVLSFTPWYCISSTKKYTSRDCNRFCDNYTTVFTHQKELVKLSINQEIEETRKVVIGLYINCDAVQMKFGIYLLLDQNFLPILPSLWQVALSLCYLLTYYHMYTLYVLYVKEEQLGRYDNQLQ